MKRKRIIILLVLLLVLGLLLTLITAVAVNRYVAVIPAQSLTPRCPFSPPPLIEIRHRESGKSLCLSKAGVAFPLKRIIFIR